MANSQRSLPRSVHGWDEHNLAQLRYFRLLPLREKLQAVEGMADVVRRFQQIRAQGGFKAASRRLARPKQRLRHPLSTNRQGNTRRTTAPGAIERVA